MACKFAKITAHSTQMFQIAKLYLEINSASLI